MPTPKEQASNTPSGTAEKLYNEGQDAQNAGDDDLALNCFRRSLEIQDLPVTRSAFAISLRYLNRFADAFGYINDSLTHYPGDPWLLYQRALTLLQLGHWSEGWRDYEIRLSSPFHPARPMWRPQWNGEPGDVCVYREQGVGDEIMFASCIPDLMKEVRGHVYIETSPRMAPLMRESFPEATVYTLMDGEMPGSPLYDVPIGSLPRLFRQKEKNFWERYAWLNAGEYEKRPLPSVGVAWAGGTSITRRAQRTINPLYLLPALSTFTGSIINLQWDARPDEIAAIERKLGLDLNHDASEFVDFLALARRIMACDMVVSVCSSIVHLAGALGVPCICLTPYVPEWRYGVHKGVWLDSSPWYQSVTLYRQDKTRHWFPVIERLARVLETQILTA